MKKILFIIPYFGNFRSDISFFLKSVEKNPTIDFIVFTNQQILHKPKNLRVINCELSYLEQLAKENIWEGCVLTKAYKICDYRPAYGLMFNKYIEGYDFWGHCDTDMIFGDIRSYYPDERLEKYDRHGKNGPFTLYKNNTFVNNLFKEAGNITEIFTNQKPFGFDEWGGQKGTTIFWEKVYPNNIDQENNHDNLQPYHYSFISTWVVRTTPKMKNLCFSYENGKLYRIGLLNNKIVKEESLYVHLQKRPIIISTFVDDYFTIIPPGKYIAYVPNVNKFFLKWKVRDNPFWTYYTRFRNKMN